LGTAKKNGGHAGHFKVFMNWRKNGFV
jgi:hypothetical protein